MREPVYFTKSKYFREAINRDPFVIVDAGARGGINTKWDFLDEHIRYFGFEPDLEECKRLNKKARKNHAYFPVALYNKSGTICINITGNPVNSSIYQPNTSLWQYFPNMEELKIKGSVDFKCDTLDNIFLAEGFKNIDIFKLDTQGSEKEILEGSVSALKNFIFAVDIEVEFSELYKGQPFFADVDILLRDMGFNLFDIKPARLKRKCSDKIYSKGQVLWARAIYFKDILLRDSDGYLNKMKFEKAIKTISLAEFYGYPDFALDLLKKYRERCIVKESDYKDIENLLLKNRLSKLCKIFKKIF